MKHLPEKSLIAVMCLLISITAGFTNQFHDQADGYWNRAMASKKEKKYKDAIDHLTAAVIAERKSGNVRNGEYLSQLKELGGLYVMTGDIERAEKCYRMIIEFSSRIGDQASESEALFGLGRMYHEHKEYDRAIESFRGSLEIETRINRADRTVAALNGIAGVYRDRGEFAQSAEHYQQAIENLGSADIEENRAALLNNLGTARFFSGDFRQALACFTKAREIDEKGPVKKHLSSDYANMASAYHVMGRLNEAIDLYTRALEIDRKDNGEKVPSRLFRLAEAHHQKGEYEKALAFSEDSLNAMKDTGDLKNMSHVFSQIGRTYDSMGQYERALENYLKAAEAEGGGDTEAAMSRLADIGMFYEARGMYDEAYNYFQIALKSGKESAGRLSRAENFRNAGRVLLYMKRYGEAQKYLQQAAGIDESIGNREGLARDYDFLGRGRYMSGQYAEAADIFRKAIDIMEQAGSRGKEPGEQEREAYSWLVAALVKSGTIEKAFEAMLDKSRRECSAYIGTGPVSGKKGGDGEQKAVIPEGAAFIAFVNVAWDEPLVLIKDASGASALNFDKKEMVKYFYGTYGAEINAYSRTMMQILNVMKGASLHNYHYDFQRIIFYYVSLLMKKEITQDEQKMILELGKDLHRFLFRGIDVRISAIKKIYVLSEDALRSFPFETLVRPDGTYLVEKHSFEHLYLVFPGDAPEKGSHEKNIAVWAEKQEPVSRPEPVIDSRRNWEFMKTEALGKLRRGESLKNDAEYFGMFGNTGIPHAREEIGMVENWLSIGNRISLTAGEEKLRIHFGVKGRDAARAVHLGCAWVSNPLVHSLSSLLFAASDKNNDGLVNMKELSGLDFNTGFATVSSAGRAMMNPGEPAGLVCASLMEAGCRGVAIPLWPVEDKARVLFLKRLYSGIERDEYDPAETLAQVKRSFISRSPEQGDMDGLYADLKEYDDGMKKISNPYFWASYVCYGR
ncbi:MAG TPA: tetratricopeptide repeat protein [Spirochaetota bacterium]|nr:tetratricopeptide repeat protein [Spirochaetota bacterium]HRZ26019.1 tetratricopeptide repeat protein [Spirochaetota bacterium]